jgi:hypothetical protein
MIKSDISSSFLPSVKILILLDGSTFNKQILQVIFISYKKGNGSNYLEIFELCSQIVLHLT